MVKISDDLYHFAEGEDRLSRSTFVRLWIVVNVYEHLHVRQRVNYIQYKMLNAATPTKYS